MTTAALQTLVTRLSDTRTAIITQHPFFGRLLLHLPVGLGTCETACTDMTAILFGVDFAAALSDEELSFVMLHELMHCVLKHPLRGGDKIPLLYNIACDIVINSMLLEAMGKDEFMIDGEPVMHLSPNGREGREQSAEEVYRQLMPFSLKELEELFRCVDNHDDWDAISEDTVLESIWNKHIIRASKASGFGSGIPQGIRRIVDGVIRQEKVDWRQILRQYIQFDRHDYVFSVPDKRFSGDIIMPSFQHNASGGKAEKLWFAVDTSGSVSDANLAEALAEIKDAIRQVGTVSGCLSFFDSSVSEPIPFENIEDLDEIKPIGGGGTSFKEVFRFMHRHFRDDLPAAVIIMTDGYDIFPDESAAGGVDVIWLIVNSDVKPPFGEYIAIET